MGFSRRTLAIASVVIILLGALGGIYIRLRALQAEEETDSVAANDEERPEVESAQTFGTEIAIPVSATEVVRDTLVMSVSAAGQAQAYARTLLVAEVDGPVTEILVGEGDFVRSGQLLAQIDPERYAFELERARAQFEQAEAQFAELTLFDDEIGDEELKAERSRMARARSGLSAAEVGVREAELNVESATMRAPFAGAVANLAIVPGQRVQQRDSIAEIVDTGHVVRFPRYCADGVRRVDQPGGRSANAHGAGDGGAAQPDGRGQAWDVRAGADRGAAVRGPDHGAARVDPRAGQPNAGVRVRARRRRLHGHGEVDVRDDGAREPTVGGNHTG